jgi:hypothetical protein
VKLECQLVLDNGKPDDGGYYIFINRPRTHVKIIFWDGDGITGKRNVYSIRLQRRKSVPGSTPVSVTVGGSNSIKNKAKI